MDRFYTNRKIVFGGVWATIIVIGILYPNPLTVLIVGLASMFYGTVLNESKD